MLLKISIELLVLIMKKSIFVIIVLTVLISCSTFKSGLTIPANQSFLLGEYNDKNYSAVLINRSVLTVNLITVDKDTREVI